MLESKTKVGKRDERIIIQGVTRTKNNFNEDTETWSTFATVWAQVKDSTGSEGYQADQLTATNITLFDIRYLTGVTEQMRILRERNSRIYSVTGIQVPDRKRSLVLKANMLDET
jgi:SPP1 family predicted phage head-tail adaptor